MTVDEAFERIRNSRPKVVFVNGKTATGKTTFAKRLRSELEYKLIEMDTVARYDVITPLGLPDNGEVFKELYKYRNHLDWIALLIQKLQLQVQSAIVDGYPVVFEGAMPNIISMKELFSGLPHPEILFFYPANLKMYEQYVTQRFTQSNENYNALLPPSFWDMVDVAEFKKFCQTRELTPELLETISRYARYGLNSSNERLAELRQNFDDVIVVEI